MTSETWAGFSDEDIQRIKSSSNISKSCTEKICDVDGKFFHTFYMWYKML